MSQQAEQLNLATTTQVGWNREQMAQRCAQDIEDGSYVNLGIGIPEKVAQYVPDGREVIYHTENGLLGMGNSPSDEELDADLINAGKKAVTAIPGASYFHHGDSFAMIRGNHIDVCVLGAMQVSMKGDLANWSTGAVDAIPAVGGAMDLVAGVKTIYIITQHTTKDGAAKILAECTFPLTGQKVVNRIYSNLCVIDVTEHGLVLIELAPGISFEYVQERTAVALLNGLTQKEEVAKHKIINTTHKAQQ